MSAFGGKPVYYKTVDPRNQSDYEYQRDFIFGTRFAWRMPKVAEIGVSYLQDGTKAAKDLDVPSPIDYTRKQLGVDIRLTPVTMFDFRGRTVFDVASHPDQAPGAPERSRIAEHDYTATVKAGDQVTVTGNYAERNFYAFFAGTNLLFFPMHIVGLQGMPRRVYTYSDELNFTFLNRLETLGSLILGLAFLVFMINIWKTWRSKERAPADPWNGATLEWSIPSPPQEFNFAKVPQVHGRDALWEMLLLCHWDVLFAMSSGLIAQATIWLLRPWPRGQRALWIACIILGTLGIEVANVPSENPRTGRIE